MPTIKSSKFTVKSYKLWTTRDSDMVRRVISLVSEDLGHGIIVNVTLVCFPKNVYGPDRVGQVGNFGGLNFDPVSLAAWIDPTVFNSFYAVLSGESPVTFNFEYIVDPAKPDDPDKDIWSVSLTTGSEFPGDFERLFILKNFPNLADKQPA